MSDPNWPSLIDQLGAAATDAREVVAELRSELKEARRVIREFRSERDQLLATSVEEALDEKVRTGLAEYESTLREAMERGVDHVMSEFSKLERAIMVDKDGKHLRDLL